MLGRTSRLSTVFAAIRVSKISPRIQRQQRSMGTAHKLNTGATIPAVGFGTWQDEDDQEKAVTAALEAGYRHIDTARSMSSIPHLLCAN